MKIGLDYISIFGQAGAGTYTRELIKNLALLDKENNYYLYNYLHKKMPFYRCSSQLIKQDNFKYRSAILPYLTDNKYILPALRKIRQGIFLFNYKLDNLDLFHITNPANYYSNLDNFIVTVHDIAPFYPGGFVKENMVIFYNKCFKQMIKRAKYLIVDAEFTKMDILAKFNILEDKIKVIPLAADSVFRPIKNSAILEKYGINKGYILSVGQMQPRKNLPTLLKAYSLLPKELKDNYNLVLIGPSRDKDSLSQLNKIIDKEKIKDNVKILGYVDIQDLPVLYSHAYVFVYLSLLEGFGLPVLESLQCGRPVLIANNSSLPEVAGLAGIKVNPKNIEEIVLRLGELLENQGLIDDLIKKIPEQIRKFSWEKTAKKTLGVYKEVAN